LIPANKALEEKEAGEAPSAHDHLSVPHENGTTLIGICWMWNMTRLGMTLTCWWASAIVK